MAIKCNLYDFIKRTAKFQLSIILKLNMYLGSIMQRQSIKQALLDQLENSVYWQPDLITVALDAKAARANIKKKHDEIPYVVLETAHYQMERHDLQSFQDEFEPFLSELKFALENKIEIANRFQVALYYKKSNRLGHWLAIDIEIKDQKPFFLILDSVGMGWCDDVSKTIKNAMKDMDLMIYKFGADMPTQYDQYNCSRFVLQNLFAMQQFSSVIDILKKSTNDSPSKGEIDLNYKNLPIEFVKLLRPMQSISSIKEMPESYKNAIAANKSKETLASIYVRHEADNSNGRKINTFIEKKFEYYKDQIKRFILTKNNLYLRWLLGNRKVLPLQHRLNNHDSYTLVIKNIDEFQRLLLKEHHEKYKASGKYDASKTIQYDFLKLIKEALIDHQDQNIDPKLLINGILSLIKKDDNDMYSALYMKHDLRIREFIEILQNGDIPYIDSETNKVSVFVSTKNVINPEQK